MAQKLRWYNLYFLLLCNIIGTGAFIAIPNVLSSAKSPWIAISCWFVAGIIPVLFGLCYSELGSTYPVEGGDAVYIQKAYGGIVSKIYSFVSVFIILPLGVVMIIDFITKLTSFTNEYRFIITVCIVTFLSLINIFCSEGVIYLQYLLTICKVFVLGSFAIFSLLVFAGIIKRMEGTVPALNYVHNERIPVMDIVKACLIGLWPYDGWNAGNFIGHRIHKPAVTFPIGITCSLFTVNAIYSILNLSVFYVLPYEKIIKPEGGSIISAYFYNLDINESLQRILSLLVGALPPLGTASGSFLVGASIIDANVNFRKRPILMKSGCMLIFSIIVILGMGVDNQNIGSIMIYLAFCIYLFYGMSIFGILILRKKEKDINRDLVIPKALIFTCLGISAVAMFSALKYAFETNNA